LLWAGFPQESGDLRGSLLSAMRHDVTKAFELLRSGNSADVEQALELLQNTVFSFSMTVCGHREDAEDTMQEVLLKAIPFLAKFDSPKALTTWLYTVARNRCWMSRRKSKFAPREHLSLEELMPDATELNHLGAIAAAGPSPEKLAIVGQDARRLQQAILKIPPPYRLVLVLHDIEELSTDEIARILSLKERNVRVRLHRARLFVRKELSQLAPKPANKAWTAPSAPTPDSPDGATGKADHSRRCKEIFANLSDYLDGALDNSLCKELERHMGGCKPCEAFLSSLRNTIEQTHSLPSQRPDPRVFAQVRARLARQVQMVAAEDK
jgi:RNA polymerase sigma-70 factor (ECF subfamily)